MKKNKNQVWLTLLLIFVIMLFVYRDDAIRGKHDGFYGIDRSTH